MKDPQHPHWIAYAFADGNPDAEQVSQLLAARHSEAITTPFSHTGAAPPPDPQTSNAVWARCVPLASDVRVQYSNQSFLVAEPDQRPQTDPTAVP